MYLDQKSIVRPHKLRLDAEGALKYGLDLSKHKVCCHAVVVILNVAELVHILRADWLKREP